MTDWFSPASGQRPQQPPQPPPPLQHRPVPPDHQVWPPVAPTREPAGSSTQPLPAVPSAGPLPRRQPHPSGPPAPPGPPTEPPTGPPTGPPAREAAAQPPRRPRLLLQGVGAIVALAVAIGAPTYDRYLLYQGGQPKDRVHLVAAGQGITFEHVTWKVTYGTMPAPQGSRHNTPDKQWLKIAITRTAEDKDGAQLTGQPEVRLKDRAGRAWQLETLEDTAPSDHVVGESYVTTKVAVVPSAVAKEVELELRPSSYRSDTPIEDLMKSTEDDNDDVLRFRR
ncbi:hypothetical protein GCM10010404_19390 [Nonomuraea africana]|uniref:Uncharacterized protein n=1 Tax=Nonomuraea africana TaxID=46171 RepID=A0ABR9KTY0_9ACTN|nr:hypothetical protein [Nonomuraea africana]MBE1565200.1 hypothetical protein [Nonomuraea africana]